MFSYLLEKTKESNSCESNWNLEIVCLQIFFSPQAMAQKETFRCLCNCLWEQRQTDKSLRWQIYMRLGGSIKELRKSCQDNSYFSYGIDVKQKHCIFDHGDFRNMVKIKCPHNVHSDKNRHWSLQAKKPKSYSGLGSFLQCISMGHFHIFNVQLVRPADHLGSLILGVRVSLFKPISNNKCDTCFAKQPCLGILMVHVLEK